MTSVKLASRQRHDLPGAAGKRSRRGRDRYRSASARETHRCTRNGVVKRLGELIPSKKRTIIRAIGQLPTKTRCPTPGEGRDYIYIGRGVCATGGRRGVCLWPSSLGFAHAQIPVDGEKMYEGGFEPWTLRWELPSLALSYGALKT